jgi:hypothetical protein
VAQRFTAATTGLSSAPAAAAEATLRREKDFFRKRLSITRVLRNQMRLQGPGVDMFPHP